MTTPLIYDVYGIRVRTPWRLPSLTASTNGPWDVEFIEGDPARLERAAEHVPSNQAGWWAQSAVLPDGSTYRRWARLFDFLVRPGARQIEARMLEHATEEAFQAYLLVDGLLHAMVRLGREPLHATAVMTTTGAVAFLGESGHGKSTIAALLLDWGYPLLTDDMLIAILDGGSFLAYPGPPRIKLYRAVAQRIFGDRVSGVPMNPATEKLIIPLAERQTTREPGRLRALYVLAPQPGSSTPPSIRRVSPSEALPAVLGGTAGVWPRDPARLRRQFDFITSFVRKVPIRMIRFAHEESGLFPLRDLVLADLEGGGPAG